MYSCVNKGITNSRVIWGLIVGIAIAFTNETVAENPLEMPEYTQTLVIKYASPTDAQSATLKKLELPGDKKLAFSTRWDDTNPRHLKMAQTLAGQGWKGTFHLNNFDKKTFTCPTEILKLGSSIGTHSFDHPTFCEQIPAAVFRQILDERILVESTFNTCVNAFVLPFGVRSYHTPFKDYVQHMVGEAAKRSGHLGGDESDNEITENFGLSSDSWFSGNNFNINDRNPSKELFAQKLEIYSKIALTPGCPSGPHISLGTHVIQSDQGFVTIEEIFKDYGNNPDWWYCNENEFLAYRYQFLHTGINKKSTNGNTVTFELTRIAAPELGHDIGLMVRANGKIDSVTLDGKPLAVSNNLIDLPHSPGRTVPVEIEAVNINPKSSTPVQAGSFQGIQMNFDDHNDKISFACNVAPSEKLGNVSVILRVPPAWKDGNKRAMPVVKAGKFSVNFELGKRDERPIFQEGDCNFYVQVDALCNGIPKRLHASLSVPNKLATPDPTSPRDNAVVVGPLATGTFTPELLEQISLPSAKLTNFGTGNFEKWRAVFRGFDAASPTLDVTDGRCGRWSMEARKYLKTVPSAEYAFVLEFDGGTGECCQLLQNFWRSNEITAIYINGKAQKLTRSLDFTPIAGRNRIVLVYPTWITSRRMASVSRTGDIFDHVKFLPVEGVE